MVRVYLFGDLKRKAGVDKVEAKGGRPLIDIIREIAEKYGLRDLIFRNDRVRGELLLIVDGADWNSLGYLDNIVEEDSKVKLVPIWHGG